MEFTRCRDVAALADAVTDVVLAVLHEKPDALLAWPTGRTTLPVLERWRTRAVPLSEASVVLLDEYLTPERRNVDAAAHYSCAGWAARHLADLRPGRVLVPRGDDPEATERALADAGGLDLAVVGIGASDAHVAFNPPGTPATSRTRVIDLADSTRADNLTTFPDFAGLDEVPRLGVSLGLGTLLDARHLVAVAHGPDKRDVVARTAAAAGFDPDCPASFVHLHPRGRLVTAD